MIILQSSAFIVEIPKDTETTVASMVDKSCRITVTVTSQNRWHFSGKESQSFLNTSIPLLDFGARLYNPTIARWTTSDPLSEKYHGISPYAYCLGNPISIIDPNGMDIWTMDEYGNVVWKKESDDHRLYYVNKDGTWSEDYVSVSDRSILDDLTKTETKVDGGAEVSSHTSKTGINDIFKVFKFAADKTKVEWTVHRNGDTYIIGTGHNSLYNLDDLSIWEGNFARILHRFGVYFKRNCIDFVNIQYCREE